MKRRVTVTEGKAQEIAGVRIDVRRKPRHKRQFVVMVEVPDSVINPAILACLSSAGRSAGAGKSSRRSG
ncbi:MAG TPA: hypothetical protein VGH74_16370 [Planctomycetaceae bacterium]